MRVFILDDVRSVRAAFLNAGLIRDDRVPPYTYSIARNILDGRDIIASSNRFDWWILDNDLGGTEEGYEFLKLMITTYPSKVPDDVVSCSANPVARANIVALMFNWIANGRQPLLPIGADE